MKLPSNIAKKSRAEQANYDAYWGKHDHALVERGKDKDGYNWGYAYQETWRTKKMELLDEWATKNGGRVVPYQKIDKQAREHAERNINKLIRKHNAGHTKRDG